MYKACFIGLAISLGVTVLCVPDRAAARSFGGYECRGSCVPYARGYRWAEAGHVTDPRQCGATNSEAFRSGCLVYIEDPHRGADADDDGDPI